MSQDRSVLLALVLGWAAFALVGCGGKGESQKGPKEAEQGTAEKEKKSNGADTSTGKADASMTAEEFQKAISGKTASGEKVKGKTVDLTGVVAYLTRDAGGDITVALALKSDPSGILCFTESKDIKGITDKLTPGQTATLRGKCPTDSTILQLLGCQIVSVKGERAPVVSAEALAKEYETDPESAKKKYDKKWTFVTGEVIAKAPGSADSLRLDLKGTSKTKVVFYLSGEEKAQAAKVMAGMKVRCLAEYAFDGILTGTPGELAFNVCRFIGQDK